MSNKNLIIIIISGLILIGGSLAIFFFMSREVIQQTTTSTTTNPFGEESGEKTFGTNIGTQNGGFGDQIETTNNKLIQLYRNPTSGSVFYLNKNNQTVLRFIDRAIGNVYEYLPDSQTGEANRITNTTIPKIQESVWSTTGDNLILRYLDNDTDNINSFSAKIQKTTDSTDTPGELSGQFLTSNIKQLVINPKGDRVFGLVDKSDKSGTYGFISNLDGSNKRIIFDSQILYWTASWPKENTITLTTKPNYTDQGLLYFFNPQDYSMNRVFGNIVGLSTITNKDSSFVAYSYTDNNSFNLDIFDTTNKSKIDIKVPTLADKCIWGLNNSKILYCAIPRNIPINKYPDSWYQGLESFVDDIWKIDSETGNVSQIYQVGTNESINLDVLDLKISPDDKYLSITNKTDLSLWLLEIME